MCWLLIIKFARDSPRVGSCRKSYESIYARELRSLELLDEVMLTISLQTAIIGKINKELLYRKIRIFAHSCLSQDNEADIFVQSSNSIKEEDFSIRRRIAHNTIQSKTNLSNSGSMVLLAF